MAIYFEAAEGGEKERNLQDPYPRGVKTITVVESIPGLTENVKYFQIAGIKILSQPFRLGDGD